MRRSKEEVKKIMWIWIMLFLIVVGIGLIGVSQSTTVRITNREVEGKLLQRIRDLNLVEKVFEESAVFLIV